MTNPNQCELGVHCNGQGKIQLHVVSFNVLVCIKCAAGEEGITQKEVREHLRSGEYYHRVHRARSATHQC